MLITAEQALDAVEAKEATITGKISTEKYTYWIVENHRLNRLDHVLEADK